jgi:copper chaperone
MSLPIELNVNNLSDTLIKAEHSKASFKVIGMYCISCKPIVEKQLKDEKGVKSIKFDYTTDSITIEFDPSVLTREEIKRLDNLDSSLSV